MLEKLLTPAWVLMIFQKKKKKEKNHSKISYFFKSMEN